MTVAEEVGLEGANALDPALVTGSILINLDSEEDGKLTVGCAGSTDTWIRIEAPREQAADDAVTLAVTRERRAGRPLRDGDRAGTVERGQGARPRAARDAWRRCRSGSSRSTAARVATRSRATRSPSARSQRDREQAFRDAVATAAETIRDAFAKTDAGVSVDDRRRRGLPMPVDRCRHGLAARCRRSRADGTARAEPGFRRSRRDEHVARGGDHGG